MDAAGRLQAARSSLEAAVKYCGAIRVCARWRISLVQCQPLVCLLDAVVMEFVVHQPRPQGVCQVALHVFWKLARVNGQGSE